MPIGYRWLEHGLQLCILDADHSASAIPQDGLNFLLVLVVSQLLWSETVHRNSSFTS